MQTALLARGKPMAGNVNLLLRAGLWSAVYVASALVFPSLRTLSAVGAFWLGGVILSHLWLLHAYRRDFLDVLFARNIKPVNYFKVVRGRAAAIYLSDIGLAGSLYVDRFLITAIVGLSDAGIYFYFSSIIGAVYIVCMAATVQIFQPQLRAAYAKGGADELYAAMRPRLRQTIAISTAAFLLAGPSIWIMLKFIGRSDLQNAIFIAPILLLGYGMKIVSEFFSISLAAAERDREYTAYHMASLVLTVICGCLTIPFMGYTGAAMTLLIVSTILVAVRSRAILSASRSRKVERFA